MFQYRNRVSYNDFRERDAALRDMQTRLHRARAQGNKHLANEIEKAMKKVG